MPVFYSIFNDALGPVMTGPSSSHSAGCCRIGLTAACLFGREIRKADVIFEEKGSYPSTYIGQGSSFGFTGGLMGITSDDVRLKDAVRIARDEGRKIVFKKGDLGFKHPNQAKIVVYNEDDAPEMELMTFSVGGGMFQITEMDGFTTSIEGGNEQGFALFETADAADELVEELGQKEIPHSLEEKDGRFFVNAKPFPGVDISFMASYREKKDCVYVRFAKPVVAIEKYPDKNPPFFNAEEALEYSEKHGLTIDELAVAYECGYGLADREKIDRIVADLAAVMRRSVEEPDPETTPMYGFLPYSCRKMKEKLKERSIVDTGIMNKVMMAAISVMENSCAHNIIVAAPTAGSSGVVPAAVVTAGDLMGKSDEEIGKALLAAGLIGAFIANQATFGGEVGACQAENGSASAMAAAGVVALLGGSVKEAFNAANLALQNMLGLICDPVAGLTEIPCISRNVSAAANAIQSANMAVLGYDPVIPLDQTIETMGRVGSQLPAELRCTCEGGLCTTPEGCRIGCEVEKSRPVL